MLVLVQIVAGIDPAHAIAAILPLEVFTQVGQQDVTLNERIAEVGNPHGTTDGLPLCQPVELTVEVIKSAGLPCRIVYDAFRPLGPHFPEVDSLSILVVRNGCRRLLGRWDDLLQFLLLPCKVTQDVYLPQFRPIYLESREEMEEKEEQCHQKCQHQGSADVIFHLLF